MTKKVLKWDVPVDDQLHSIGSGKVVHVDCQKGPEIVQVWTEESLAAPYRRDVQVYGTGQDIGEEQLHLGSVVIENGVLGSLAWHVYTDASA